jgi:hypothetical protein
MENKKYYLKCEISEGIFSSEKGVSFKDINGRNISGFFQNEYIKNNKLLEIRVAKIGKDKSLICPPCPENDGYRFFQGNAFYVDNKLISESE